MLKQARLLQQLPYTHNSTSLGQAHRHAPETYPECKCHQV